MTHRGCATPEPSCRTPPRWTGSWWCGRPGRLAFERLQEQAKRRGAGAARLAEARPAHFVAFDLLRLAGTSTMSWPYTGRREALEHLFPEHRLTAPWRLCPSTTDPGTVREWVTWTQAGVEGVLFKTGWTFPAGWSTRESLHVTLVRPRAGRGGRCGHRPGPCRTPAAPCPVAPVPPRHLFLRRPGLRGGRLLTAQPRGAPAVATRTAAAAPSTRRAGRRRLGRPAAHEAVSRRCRICRAAAA
ncbi:ATP-dependent DNA ligase [Streptomyces misionensis]|uniref:ATP-dependent DNA ligase n=1 Tax=Streptomyces misionensis TaxID=67331 RepID=UPI00339E41D2